MELNGKKTIVFGGSGFIGKNFAESLSKLGANVTIFDLVKPSCSESIQYIKGDFFDDNQIEAALIGQDFIVHSICTINPTSSVDHYMRGYQQDFAHTAKLCDIANRSKKRLLFLSSGGTVYREKSTPLLEIDSREPSNHYGSLKVCIEDMMLAFMRAGADFRIARISNAYGPGQDYRKGVGFIDAAIKHALRSEPIEIWGDGTIVRDYIYIDDICHMLSDVLRYDGDDRIFNIGTGYGTSQNQIIDMLRQYIKSIDINYMQARAIDRPCIILDIGKYLRTFQFLPRSVSVGIKEYISWLQQ